MVTLQRRPPTHKPRKRRRALTIRIPVVLDRDTEWYLVVLDGEPTEWYVDRRRRKHVCCAAGLRLAAGPGPLPEEFDLVLSTEKPKGEDYVVFSPRGDIAPSKLLEKAWGRLWRASDRKRPRAYCWIEWEES